MREKERKSERKKVRKRTNKLEGSLLTRTAHVEKERKKESHFPLFLIINLEIAFLRDCFQKGGKLLT